MAVIGGGDSAFQEAVYLTRFASKVYLIHRSDDFRAAQDLQARALANSKVEIIRSHVVERIDGTDKVESLLIRNVKDDSTRTLELGAVFIFIGFDPYGPRLFRDHIRHDPQCYILTDDARETEIPGVFAAGDTRAQLARQITTACAIASRLPSLPNSTSPTLNRKPKAAILKSS